jgi:hypothetical protein
MPRKQRPRPTDHCPAWPAGPASDPATERFRCFVEQLQLAIDNRTLRAVEQLTEVDRSTLAAILNGQTWPDTLTLARLEIGLDQPLWNVRSPKRSLK